MKISAYAEIIDMKLDWNKGEKGLLPVIVQDANSKEVLM
ncbi:bifunctional phosphoribosyl-AMP cyclohydrolase/phosphoribosyl-ATP diphosphatase, partial [Nonlabens mediterrranea]|nr:bifunctional phosphoribosyl-AMP cyclohydrolase/phosphoribosyl-ATP diphosphatase [Nonlabens mediterrranea]